MNRVVPMLCLGVLWTVPVWCEDGAVKEKAGDQPPKAEAKPAAEAKAEPAAPAPKAAEGKPEAEKPAEAPKAGDAPKAADSDAAAKAATLEKENQELKQQVTDLQGQVAKLNTEIQALRDANQQLEAKISGKEMGKSQKEIEKCISQFRGTNTERFKARSELKKYGKVAVPALIKAAQDEHPYVRETAIQTLGDIGDPAAVPALLDVLAGNNLDLARQAVRALELISNQYFGAIGLGEAAEERQDVVNKWKQWWKENSEKLLGGGK